MLALVMSAEVVMRSLSSLGISSRGFTPSVVKKFLRKASVGADTLFLALFSFSFSVASWASTILSLS